MSRCSHQITLIGLIVCLPSHPLYFLSYWLKGYSPYKVLLWIPLHHEYDMYHSGHAYSPCNGHDDRIAENTDFLCRRSGVQNPAKLNQWLKMLIGTACYWCILINTLSIDKNGQPITIMRLSQSLCHKSPSSLKQIQCSWNKCYYIQGDVASVTVKTGWCSVQTKFIPHWFYSLCKTPSFL